MIRVHGDCVPARRHTRAGGLVGVPPGVAGYEDYLRRGSQMYRFRELPDSGTQLLTSHENTYSSSSISGFSRSTASSSER